jgi:serine/threonine protein kinase
VHNTAPDTLFSLEKTEATECRSFYRLGRCIGKGSYGKIMLGLHLLSRCVVAIKTLRNGLDDPKYVARIDNEFKILGKLRHRNVVKYFEPVSTDSHMLYVMELCAGMDLLSYVRRRRQLEEPLSRYFFRQLIIGIGYIH